MKPEPEPILVSVTRTVVWSGRRILLFETPGGWRTLCENPQLADARFVRIAPDLGHWAGPCVLSRPVSGFRGFGCPPPGRAHSLPIL
ncbi:MAG TPA: hypothetical protein PKM73_17005 [Verrucomicrobiota bacterium]|nr:hypothetical protein [Verrucomicrobiota bacterium]HNU51622.1 hypothetical protein [Verrucomicrobiota bacterium]